MNRPTTPAGLHADQKADRWHPDPPPLVYGPTAAERREQAAIRRDDKARKAAGIKAHRPEPFDPWADVEWRVCAKDCAQHRSAS